VGNQCRFALFEYVGASVDLIVPVNIRLAPFLTKFRFIGETQEICRQPDSAWDG